MDPLLLGMWPNGRAAALQAVRSGFESPLLHRDEAVSIGTAAGRGRCKPTGETGTLRDGARATAEVSLSP